VQHARQGRGGGALGNALDRLLIGGATDVLYVGWGPVWNLADVALIVGTVLATRALVRWRSAQESARVLQLNAESNP
jgi:lipoprotein signal peptidase